jgi:hypothetical protein
MLSPRTHVRILATVALLLGIGCTNRSHPTDLTIRLETTPEAKPAVVALLDRLSKERGWVRQNAAPGLNDLGNRKITYFSYGRRAKDILIVITDVKKESELEVSAFLEPEIPGVVEKVAAQFAVEAKAVSGVLSVKEEPAK